MAGVRLSDAIFELRSELTRSMQEGGGERIRFELGPIELEMTLVAQEEKAGGLNVKWMLFTAEASAKGSNSATHKLKLILKPELRTPPGQDIEAAAATEGQGRPVKIGKPPKASATIK